MALHSRNSLKTLEFLEAGNRRIHQTPYIYGGPSGAPYKQARKAPKSFLRRERRKGGFGAPQERNEVVICDLLSGRF